MIECEVLWTPSTHRQHPFINCHGKNIQRLKIFVAFLLLLYLLVWIYSPSCHSRAFYSFGLSLLRRDGNGNNSQTKGCKRFPLSDGPQMARFPMERLRRCVSGRGERRGGDRRGAWWIRGSDQGSAVRAQDHMHREARNPRRDLPQCWVHPIEGKCVPFFLLDDLLLD